LHKHFNTLTAPRFASSDGLQDLGPELFKTKRAGYLTAISIVENGDAKGGYVNDFNRSLDHILEKAKECGILSVIEADVRRVRVAGHMAAIGKIARGDAAGGYVDDMNKSLGHIEQTAKQYSIFDDVKDEIQKTRNIGLANSKKR